MKTRAAYSFRTKLLRRHYSGPGKAFMLPLDTYKQWVIMTSETGVFHYRIADRSGEVHIGEMVLCPPGLTFYRQALSPLAFHFIEFQLDIVDDRTGLPEQDVMPYGKISYRNISRVLSTFECMRDASEPYMEHLIEDLMFQYMRELNCGTEGNSTRDEAVTRANDYILKHAFEDISMQQLASLVGLSPSQFTRKFKSELGVSPNVYLTQMRMQKAKTLLLETAGSLQQIAEQCGYDNAFYFSRVFTKCMNMCPSKYRKTQQI